MRTNALLLLLILAASPAIGQVPNQPPSPVNEDDATLPETGLGNVVQTALFHYGSGARLLDQSRKLAAKLEQAESAEKRAKMEKKVASLREQAIEELKDAIGYNPRLLEAYAVLGAALSESGKPDQALGVHARALGMAPEDTANFRGWARALLALDLLGDATQTYASLVETRPEQAAELLAQLKRWLEEKRADPGGLEAADIERLAVWIERQESGAG